MKRKFNKNNGILIIGGGLLQSYALKKAKEKKIKVYLVDGSEMCYSKTLADKFFKIDIKDHKKVANQNLCPFRALLYESLYFS